MITADKSYCDICQPIVDKKRKAAIEAYRRKANKKYDKQRDPKYSAFYHSTEWRMLSQLKVMEAGYQCEECKKQGIVSVATEVHHIEPIQTNEGWQRRLDENNLIVLCAACHNKKHKRFCKRNTGGT